MEGVSTLWDDVRLLAWEAEAEAEGLETDGALVLCVPLAVGDDWDGWNVHGGKGVGREGEIVGRGGGGGGIGRAQRGRFCVFAQDGVEGLEGGFVSGGGAWGSAGGCEGGGEREGEEGVVRRVGVMGSRKPGCRR